MPDDNTLLYLSNAPRYGLEQNLFFQSEPNSCLKTTPVAEGQYYSRPDMRPEVLSLPLKTDTRKKKKKGAWCINLKDPGLKKLPANLNDKDCIVFTVDISAYDTLVGMFICFKYI